MNSKMKKRQNESKMKNENIIADVSIEEIYNVKMSKQSHSQISGKQKYHAASFIVNLRIKCRTMRDSRLRLTKTMLS